MKAVVMAGGEGSRLRPLTINRPKPLVPVCNKPVMEHIIELLKVHGIDQIVVTLHYLADEIVSYFGDGKEFGVNIVYSIEDEPLGTAGSVKKAEQYLDDTFIIISGDALTDFDLTEVIKFHKERDALATITLTRVENPLEFGVVITDEEFRIQRFLEKPSWGEVFSDTINTGIYVVEPEALDYMEPKKSYDWSNNIFPLIMEKEQPLYGCIVGGYWCDIGNLPQYRQANHDMFSKKLKALIPGKQIRKNLWIGDNSEIHPSAVINGPVVIGKNCHIKENVHIDEFTAIGDNCIIEEGATVQRSLVWPNSYIGKNARISGGILCRQSTLKQNAVISEGAIIGDKSFVGKGAVINSHVKIWPDKKIEAGAAVSMSLIWGGRWQGSLFGNDGISGLANIEITPEFALKLGAAFGSSLEKGATMITSRDSHPASRMINRAIICGLASVGLITQDLRVMPTPISRYTIRNGVARGGIHTRISPTDSRSFLLEFFDKRGINIDTSAERKIENIFFREDFRRTSLEEVGDIGFPSRALEHYTEGFFHHLDSESISKAGFKVVIDYAYNTSSLILPVLLGKLGCETVAINAYLDSKKELQAQEDRGKSLTQLSKVVTTLKADLGILMADDAERLMLIDENGTIIPDNMFLALMSNLVLKTHPGAIIAVPVSAPSILDLLAHEHKGSITRTKLDGRSVMQTAALGEKKILFAGKEKGFFIFPRFHSSFDGMFAFAKLLELLAIQNVTVSGAIDEIPHFFQAEKSVECSFADKGKVMRKLIELNRDKPVDIIDGIKIYFNGAWVLVVPEPTEPTIQIVAEGSTAENALEFIGRYENIIEALKVEEEILQPPKGAARKNLPRKEKTTEYRRTLPPEKSFHFWVPGRYLGKRSQSLKEFCDTLHYIEIDSVEYHMEREDFANWIEYELENEIMASKIRSLKTRALHGEALREEIIKQMQYRERM
jgi:mannose-1-phosphate guanylyltransferase / phosphomannomutase